MAKWKPGNNVGLNEQIGRRLFDEPMLRGAAGQPSYSGIKLTHFEETRGNEVSLDRLGASGIDRGVIRYLLPRAEAAGQKFKKPKPFDGWAAVTARELTNARKGQRFPIVASPVSDPEPDDNIYHAHVVRPNDLNSHSMALHLRYIFTTYGRIERNKKKKRNWRDRVWRLPIIKWITRWWPK